MDKKDFGIVKTTDSTFDLGRQDIGINDVGLYRGFDSQLPFTYDSELESSIKLELGIISWSYIGPAERGIRDVVNGNKVMSNYTINFKDCIMSLVAMLNNIVTPHYKSPSLYVPISANIINF